MDFSKSVKRLKEKFGSESKSSEGQMAGADHKGKVKWYNGNKRFGFITREDGQDFFVHFSDLKEGQKLRDGDIVEFDVNEMSNGKTKAVNISIVFQN